MMRRGLVILGMLCLLWACGDDDGEEVETIEVPTDFTLIFPFEDSECNEGTNITDTESTVLFEWEESENADNYELVLINLDNNEQGVLNTQETRVPIVIQRATPYAWSVTASSNETDSTVQTETWRFYNAGDGIVSYAPFPAELVSPVNAQEVNVTTGTITLKWEGADVDNDITGYDIYFSTSNPPELFMSDVSSSELNGVSVMNNNVYYCRIITKDAVGNQTVSRIFQFKVL